MDNLLQQNLLYLYHNKIDIFHAVQGHLAKELLTTFELQNDNNGNINVSYLIDDKIHWLYAEDGGDVEDWLQKHSNLAEGSYDIVMYGLGLTHHLAKLIAQSSALNFYIIEPEIDLFIQVLKVIELEELLEHPQVKLVEVGNDNETFARFHNLFNTYSEHKSIEVYIPYYAEIDIDSMKEFYKLNYMYKEDKILKFSYENLFGTQPYRNSIRNIEAMIRADSIKVLKNKYVDCTALIVGAGPSLEKDVELIKQYYDKMLIIAAGSSIQSLLHYGIRPHFIVSMDPGEANGRVFCEVDTSNIPLVFTPTIYDQILNNKFLRLFYAFFNDNSITDYLFSDKEIDYRLDSTVTVTGTAIQVARYLGAKVIVLAGQDLSFPNDNYYAQGAGHGDMNDLNKKIKLSDMEIENVQGGVNRTNYSMKIALENIESLLSTMRDVQFINTSSLGARIKGADFIPFAVMGRQLSDAPYNFSNLSNISKELTIGNENYDILLSKLVNLTQIFEGFIFNNEKSLKIIKKIDGLSRISPNKAMNQLVKLENEFSKVTDHAMFKSFISRWSWGLTNKYDQQVIKIEAEPTMIGKAKLLNQIVVPYIKEINKSIMDIQAEFQDLIKKLTLSKEKIECKKG